MKHTPNIITFLHIAFVPVLASAIWHGDYDFALLLVVAMGVSDGLDGFLAKTYGWCSPVGERLDPLADKLMLVTAFAALAVVGVVPVWFAILVASRDLLLVLWGVSQWYASGELTVRPMWLSKVNTFVQIVFVVNVLAAQVWPAFDAWSLELLMAAAFTTIASGAMYIRRFPGLRYPSTNGRAAHSKNIK